MQMYLTDWQQKQQKLSHLIYTVRLLQDTLLENETLVSMAGGLLGYENHDPHVAVMHKVHNVNSNRTREIDSLPCLRR